MTRDGREHFYEERDRRTVGYGIPDHYLERPVRISVGDDAASSPAGQALVLAAVNMACRVHRRIHIAVPDSELLITTLAGGRTLREAAERLALAIDPYIRLDSPPESVPTLGIGRVRATLHVGADGYAAEVSEDPNAVSDHPASIIGAGLAACIGTASLFQLVIDRRPVLRRVSLWRFQDGRGVEVGPRAAVGPVDVGDRVALIGAGRWARPFSIGCACSEWPGGRAVVGSRWRSGQTAQHKPLPRAPGGTRWLGWRQPRRGRRQEGRRRGRLDRRRVGFEVVPRCPGSRKSAGLAASYPRDDLAALDSRTAPTWST